MRCPVPLTSDIRSYDCEKLSNGLEIISSRLPDYIPTTTKLFLSISAGSNDDPHDYPGLAHLMEHGLFLGNWFSQTTWETTMLEVAGEVNAQTDDDLTSFYVVGNIETPDKVDLLINRFASMFLYPELGTDPLGRETRAVDAEHRKNSMIPQRALVQMIFTSLLGRSPVLERFRTGTLSTLLHSQSRKDVEATRMAAFRFLKSFYCASNALLWIDSNVTESHRDSIDRLTSAFSMWSQSNEGHCESARDKRRLHSTDVFPDPEVLPVGVPTFIELEPTPDLSPSLFVSYVVPSLSTRGSLDALAEWPFPILEEALSTRGIVLQSVAGQDAKESLVVFTAQPNPDPLAEVEAIRETVNAVLSIPNEAKIQFATELRATRIEDDGQQLAPELQINSDYGLDINSQPSPVEWLLGRVSAASQFGAACAMAGIRPAPRRRPDCDEDLSVDAVVASGDALLAMLLSDRAPSLLSIPSFPTGSYELKEPFYNSNFAQKAVPHHSTLAKRTPLRMDVVLARASHRPRTYRPADVTFFPHPRVIHRSVRSYGWQYLLQATIAGDLMLLVHPQYEPSLLASTARHLGAALAARDFESRLARPSLVSAGRSVEGGWGVHLFTNGEITAEIATTSFSKLLSTKTREAMHSAISILEYGCQSGHGLGRIVEPRVLPIQEILSLTSFLFQGRMIPRRLLQDYEILITGGDGSASFGLSSVPICDEPYDFPSVDTSPIVAISTTHSGRVRPTSDSTIASVSRVVVPKILRKSTSRLEVPSEFIGVAANAPDLILAYQVEISLETPGDEASAEVLVKLCKENLFEVLRTNEGVGYVVGAQLLRGFPAFISIYVESPTFSKEQVEEKVRNGLLALSHSLRLCSEDIQRSNCWIYFELAKAVSLQLSNTTTKALTKAAELLLRNREADPDCSISEQTEFLASLEDKGRRSYWLESLAKILEAGSAKPHSVISSSTDNWSFDGSRYGSLAEIYSMIQKTAI